MQTENYFSFFSASNGLSFIYEAFFYSRMYGNLFLKHDVILSWECCLTVFFLQLHRMILLYEFFKEASIYSAFEMEEVIRVILKNLINAPPLSFRSSNF